MSLGKYAIPIGLGAVAGLSMKRERQDGQVKELLNDHEAIWSIFVGEPKGKDYEAFVNASISEKEQMLKSKASDTDDALWRSKEWMRISENPEAEKDYIQSARAVEWDKKISKIEIENDLSNFDDDELYELANWYKYPQGNRHIDSERSKEYSNRIWNEIEKRKNPFTEGLPQGDTMSIEDFR